MKPTHLGLCEFASTTGITPKRLLVLIDRGVIAVTTSSTLPLAIQVETLPENLKELIREKPSTPKIDLSELEKEVIASEVANACEMIMSEAIELALSWQKQDEKTEES